MALDFKKQAIQLSASIFADMGKETMVKIKTYAGVAICPQCHNSINIQGATTTLGKISCKCGYEVQFDLGGKNGS